MGNRPSRLNTVGGVLAGYLIVVPIAVFTTISFIVLPTILPDNGNWGSFYAMSQEASGFVLPGLMITAATAWPGYGLTLYLAVRRKFAPSRLFFAMGGALTAMQAHTLFGIYSAPAMPLGLFITPIGLASVVGGTVAGFVYSFLHVRITGQINITASPALSGS